MKAAWHESTNPCFYFDTGPILKSEQIKNPSVKRGRRFNLSTNVLVPVRAILPTWLMVADGKDGADLNAGQSRKGATASVETPMLF
jgi:hypothetical protein